MYTVVAWSLRYDARCIFEYDSLKKATFRAKILQNSHDYFVEGIMKDGKWIHKREQFMSSRY
jgi:hypothetical protein